MKKGPALSVVEGFTLIELIIAIFILSIGIVGVFGAYSAMVVATGDTSNRLIATYLAQEGLEIVTNIRNTNTTSWTDGLDCNAISSTGSCEADYTSTSLTPWPTGGDYLYTDKDSGVYDYLTTGTPTKFKRKITINISGDEMKVFVTVYWNKKGSLVSPGGLAAETNSGSITAEEYLYNNK